MTFGEPVELRGLEAIMENSRDRNTDYNLHTVEIDGPFVKRDRFAVRFAFDRTHIPTGKRRTTVTGTYLSSNVPPERSSRRRTPAFEIRALGHA